MEIKAITESIIMKRKRYGDRMEKDRGMDESEHLTSTNLLQGRETEIEREEWQKKENFIHQASYFWSRHVDISTHTVWRSLISSILAATVGLRGRSTTVPLTTSRRSDRTIKAGIWRLQKRVWWNPVYSLARQPRAFHAHCLPASADHARPKEEQLKAQTKSDCVSVLHGNMIEIPGGNEPTAVQTRPISDGTPRVGNGGERKLALWWMQFMIAVCTRHVSAYRSYHVFCTSDRTPCLGGTLGAG